MTEPRSRPMLFSGAMVQALRAAIKTQTRRIINDTGLYAIDADVHGPEVAARERAALAAQCPYGRPGDELWARESWRVSNRWDGTKPRDLKPRAMTVMYAAGGSRANDHQGRYVDDTAWPDSASPTTLPTWAGKLRPGIFMPRWASRLTLRITDVRVERLQDISEADAIAEGIERIDDPRGTAWKSYEVYHEGRYEGEPHPHSVAPNRSPVTSYRELWESLNGPQSWAANPWVWVVEFELVTEAQMPAAREAA